MGGHSRPRAFSLAVISALLSLSAIGTAAVSSSEGSRDPGCEQCAPRPPYDEPAVVIAIDWTHQERVRLNYWAAPAGSEPYSGAYWSGGCDHGLEPRPVEPLVLTQALASGKNLWYYPGAFELVAEAHACVFADDIPENLGEEGPKHLAVCAEVPSVAVTATVETFDAETSEPTMALRQRLDPVAVPLYPCDEYPDPQPFRRILSTFDWDPATGISDPKAAPSAAATSSGVAAELPPPDARLGATEVGSMPGPSEDAADEVPKAPDAAEHDAPAGGEDPSSGDATSEAGPAYQPEQVLSGDAYFSVAKLLWGIALNGQISDETRAEALSLLFLLRLLMSPDEPAQDASAVDLNAPDDTPVEPPQSALDALTGPEDDTNVAPPPITGPDAVPFVGVPPDLKPKQQKQMQNQGRVWVQLPAEARIVTGKSKQPKRTLKTKTWYQVKPDPDGRQVFYDEKGKLLGRNRRADPVRLRVWVPKEEE